MAGFMRVLTGRWVITAAGFGSAAVMVWFFGPFQSALEGWLPRAFLIVVIALVWIAVNMVMEVARRRLDRRLSEGIVRGGASTDPAKPAGAEEMKEQREGLSRAMALLRKARGTRGYLYEQPWYAIIGPPGSGKTTALANAGLRFPLAAELGRDEVKGVGGTRFCDWSFTDEAVLIDTAGRYTTQDSDETTDKAGWQAFLALLRSTRPRQPLNGVIVAIAVTEVVQVPEPDRRAHARAIRARVKELYTALGCRLPVYVVFTKLDLIHGFIDFFDDLTPEQRAQIWGTTFPPEQDHAGPAGSFGVEFGALCERLSSRVLDRLQAERSPERRTAIADFPFQFASLGAPLAAFLDEAFTGTRLEPAALLRGVYFASGTQDGAPIDRLTGVLARSFGIDQRRSPVLRPAKGRSYFLERLLKGVVFAEAMLVTSNPRAARRRRIVRGVAWGTAAAVLVVGVGLVGLGASAAMTQEREFRQAFADYQGKAAALLSSQPVPLNGADLPRVEPLLNAAKALQDSAARPGGTLPGLGLGQQDSYRQAAEVVYGQARDRILRPRLVSQAEEAMREAIRTNDLDQLYRATRVYLILCGEAPMRSALVTDWMQATWGRAYAGASNEPLRSSLARHLDVLLLTGLTGELHSDPGLRDQAQAKLANIGIGDRAYALLRSSEAARAPRPFIPADAIGALAGSHFRRRSEVSLREPVPGLFTAAGFQTVMLQNQPMAQAVDEAIGESWVLGNASRVEANNVVARQRVEADVLKRYAADYQAVWQNLLDDLDVIPPVDASAAVTDFSLLTSPQGPMKLLLTAMTKEFTLYPAADPAASPRLAPPANPSIQGVEQHFGDLRKFVQSGQMDTVFASMDQLQRQIALQLASNASGAAPALSPGIDQAKSLSDAATRAPPPVSRWLQVLALRGGAVRDQASRQQAAAAYGGPNGALPMCQQVVQRFPFSPAAAADVPMADFTDLFAPNGRFDAFFAQFVRPFVETTVPVWRLRNPAGTQAPVTAEGVAQFQRALAIRDAFFPSGNTPQVRFAIRPGFLDPSLTGFSLDLGGIAATWKAGDPRSTQTFEWPGPTHMTTVGATFDPLPASGTELRQKGPWALFRLFKDARPDRTAGQDTTDSLVLRQADRQVQLFITAGGARSPFNGNLTTQFRCPALRAP